MARPNDAQAKRRRLRGFTIGPRLILRQLRSDVTVLVALIVVVAAATAVLAATPRLFNRMADDGLQHAIDNAPPTARNVQVARDSRILAARTDPIFANVIRSGETFVVDEMPATLRDLINDQTFVVDSPRFTAEAMPEGPAWPEFDFFMRLRYQQHILDHVDLVAGRLPEPRDPILVPVEVFEEPVDPADGEGADGEEADDEGAGEEGSGSEGDDDVVEEPTHELLPLYEVAVTPETLTDLVVGVGDRMILRPDPSDLPFRDVPRGQLGFRIVLEISGLIEPIDADETYWFQDPQLQRARIVENPDYRFVYATGLMAPADYPRLLGDAGGVAWHYEWRYFIDPAGVNAGTVADLASDVRGLELSYPPTVVFELGRDTVVTGLTKVIDGYFDQRNSTVAILALVSLGLFVVTLSIVMLLASLVAARQLRSIYLLRSRGASRAQLVVSRLAEGLLVAIPAGVVGLVIARSMVVARSNGLSTQVAVAVAIASTALVLGAALPAIRSDLGTMISAGERRRPSLRRKVAEALVVIVAVTATMLLRRRGLVADANPTGRASFDPLLAAAPSLLALAVAIVTLRLYVYPIRFLGWLAAKRRRTVAFIGLRRILQQPAAARLPLLVVVLAAAVALFSGTVRSSIEEGQVRSSWNTVGADLRVSGAGDTTPLDRNLDLSAVEPIEALATGSLVETFSRSDSGSTLVEFLALQTAEYAAVVAGTKADPELPQSVISGAISEVVGTVDDPIPAVVQRSWMDARGLAVGRSFELDVGPRILTFSVAAAMEAFPSLTVGTPFVVADVDAVQSAARDILPPSLIYIRAPNTALAEIEAAVVDQAPASVVSARRAELDTVRSAPFVSGVIDGFQLAFWLSTFFGFIAVVAAFLLTARSRERDHGYLRAIGLSPRQAVATTIVEQAPPVIVAALAGSALGIGIAVLFAPGIDLAAFTGSDLAVRLLFDAGGVLTVIGALLLASWLAVAASSRLAGRVNLGEVLRLGER